MRALEATISADFASAEHAIRDALSRQGFGVLTEIDVAATLRTKLGVERPPLKILGACNPTFAQRALDIDPAVALVLRAVLPLAASQTMALVVLPAFGVTYLLAAHALGLDEAGRLFARVRRVK